MVDEIKSVDKFEEEVVDGDVSVEETFSNVISKDKVEHKKGVLD